MLNVNREIKANANARMKITESTVGNDVRDFINKKRTMNRQYSVFSEDDSIVY
jgi:hypothetical protein